jgi:hypothetical protein
MQNRYTLAAGITAGMLALAACGGGSSDAPAAAPSAAAGAVNLAGICPATVTIQTDWFPEAEHGHLYQMLGSTYTIDAKKKSVSGPLLSKGQPTGVNVQINAGGPAIGFQLVSTQMYTDKSITFGYVGTDEAIQNSKKLPTTAVFAELNTTPFMVQWDPATYPGVTDLPSLGKALKANKGVVRYFADSPYMKYLISSGVFDESVTDGSYDGTPAKFVAARGKDAQQGFASAEPYIYENEVAPWKKPVKFALLSTTGWSPYTSSMGVRTGELSTLSPCLKKLVPVLQQAEVDYFASPATANALILKLTKEYDKGWQYSAGVADYAVKAMKDNKIVADANGYVGGFDPARVEALLKIAAPIFAGSANANPDLKATDLYTNEFLDTKISLGF